MKQYDLGAAGAEKSANQGLSRITTPFGRAVGSLMLAGSFAISAPAFANDKAPTPAVQTSAPVQAVSITPFDQIEILEDAQFPANAWVADHPTRVAISVIRGSETPEQTLRNIEPGLHHLLDLEKVSIDDVRIFWEDIGTKGTLMKIHSDVHVTPPLPLTEVPAAIKSTVQKMRFDPIQQASLVRGFD